jgi:hypothetical protein
MLVAKRGDTGPWGLREVRAKNCTGFFWWRPRARITRGIVTEHLQKTCAGFRYSVEQMINAI